MLTMDFPPKYRRKIVKDKANSMHAYWVPGVNNLGKFARWAFAESTAVYKIERDFDLLIDQFTKTEPAV